MPNYRFYFVDHNNQFRDVRVANCADDQEAIEQAQMLVSGLDIEIWDHARAVRRVTSNPWVPAAAQPRCGDGSRLREGGIRQAAGPAVQAVSTSNEQAATQIATQHR